MSAMSTSEPITIGELLREARRDLAAAPFRPPVREASLLLARVLGRGEAGVLAHDDEVVPASAAVRFRQLLARRLGGEPVAYLFGEREFYGRPFDVDPRVLIPRPETEHLIETVLGLDLPPDPRLIDVGTGTGCIAVTLALEIPRARILAADLSFSALQVARCNVRRHRVADRVAAVCSDLTAALRLEPVDLVASNPPYVDPADRRGLSAEVRDFEPRVALFAADRGRAVVARLLAETAALRPGAHLVLEIAYDQSEWLVAAVAGQPPICPPSGEPAWELVDLVRDYGSIPRIAVLRRL